MDGILINITNRKVINYLHRHPELDINGCMLTIVNILDNYTCENSMDKQTQPQFLSQKINEYLALIKPSEIDTQINHQAKTKTTFTQTTTWINNEEYNEIKPLLSEYKTLLERKNEIYSVLDESMCKIKSMVDDIKIISLEYSIENEFKPYKLCEICLVYTAWDKYGIASHQKKCRKDHQINKIKCEPILICSLELENKYNIKIKPEDKKKRDGKHISVNNTDHILDFNKINSLDNNY
jgi:hypothetical protein